MNKILINIFVFLFTVSALLAQDVNDVKIGIVYSAETKQLLHKDDNNFYPIQDWELFFLNNKIHYTVYNDEQLNDYDFANEDVLILPSVEVLSGDAKQNLHHFLKSGKGILIFGELGGYDENGRKLSTDFIQDLANFTVSKLTANNIVAERHSIKANTFLNKGIPGDFSITILNRYQPLYAVRERNVENMGNYIFPTDENDLKSGIIAAVKNIGRVLWFGFHLSQISVENQQKHLLAKIIFNSIDWLSGKPFLSVSRWRNGETPPVLVENLISSPADFSSELLQNLYDLNSKNNFFINANELDNQGYRLTQLAAAGDINLNLDFSTINYKSAGLEKLFSKSAKTLRKNSKQNYFGMRLENFYEDVDSLNIFPFDFVQLNDKEIFLPGNGKNTKIFLFKNVVNVPEFNRQNILSEINEKYETALKNNQVLLVKLVDQQKEYMNETKNEYIIKVITFLKEKNANLVSYSDFIDWLKKRDNILIKTVKTTEKNKYKVTVENRNQIRVENLPVELKSGSGLGRPHISGNPYKIEFESRTGKYLITIPFLGAGMKTTFTLSFNQQ